MDRKEFTRKLMALGVCPFALSPFLSSATPVSKDGDSSTTAMADDKEFVERWLSDLLESMEKVVDRNTMVKIVEGCGKACFNRYQFKQDIAIAGKNDLDKLMEAYKKNFEIWKDGNKVHIRYGETSKQCYCPAAKYREPKPNDIHCECTKMTHQTVFETALGRPFEIKIVETLRRGGKTCHFMVDVS